jgi:hypothetical protein
MISFLSESTTSYTTDEWLERHSYTQQTHTLMVIVKMDWNRSGLLAESRMFEADWKDWNKPVMSRE